MDVNKLIPVTEYSLRDFREAKEENKEEVKETEASEEKVEETAEEKVEETAKDDKVEGNLYRRDFLTENGWQIVANFNEDDLER